MQLRTNVSCSLPIIPIVFLLTALFVSGCAQKPWKTSLGENEYESTLQIAEEMAAVNTKCNKGFQSDLTLEYANPFGKRTFSGYFLYSPGTNYKFVASNPLGQPIVIIAGNKKRYQMINTLQAKYVTGGMTSFSLRYKLPIHFLKGRWDDWLTGKNSISTEYITDISTDRELRGIWITFEDNEGARNISHLLIDPERRTIIEHVLETRQKKPLATIRYSDYIQDQSCLQPQNINITGLEYGTTIKLQLSETKLTSRINVYKLTPPQGYWKQFRP
ncbi:MAG: hypothetical protein COA36_00675 [Desulfotalea sp.]|nr:MAG: hypothetical protein COA36_00675 [Desulfotalea sp.]